MAEELLDGLEVKAGQKQVTGEGVPEGMRRNALGDACLSDSRFDGTLDVGFMNMIAAHFLGLAEEGKLGGGEEPLPNIFAGGVFVFPFELKGFGQVRLVQALLETSG